MNDHTCAATSPNGVGPRPASGLYARHVIGLALTNVTLSFEQPTAKPVLVFHDVKNATLDHLTLPTPTNNAPPARFDQSPTPTIKNSPTLTGPN